MTVTREMGTVLPDTSMTSPVYIDARKEPFVLSGFYAPYTRMPLDVAEKVSKDVYRISQMTPGCRVRFRTNSEFIAFHADIPYEEKYNSESLLVRSGFDIYFKENGKYMCRGILAPSEAEGKPYHEARWKYSGEMKDVVIFFPRNCHISNFYIGLQEGCTLDYPSEYKYKKPVLFYGSSIVHGCGSSRPSSSYPCLISRRLDCDFINLGFGGAAKGEIPMMEYIAEQDMSVFVYDYDHNAPSPEHLRDTHFRGYEIFRKKHPDTPVIMASKVDYHHSTTGEYLHSDVSENAVRRGIILESYNRALALGDKNVYFVDGREIYPEDKREECTFDGCHPSDVGYQLMADAFGGIIAGLLGAK